MVAVECYPGRVENYERSSDLLYVAVVVMNVCSLRYIQSLHPHFVRIAEKLYVVRGVVHTSGLLMDRDQRVRIVADPQRLLPRVRSGIYDPIYGWPLADIGYYGLWVSVGLSLISGFEYTIGYYRNRL